MKAFILISILAISSSFSSEEKATGALQMATTEVVEAKKSVMPRQEVRQTKHVAQVNKEIRQARKVLKADVRDGIQRMDSKLKIGLFLLAIGAVLSIVGISLVGGIAALIGLGFTIIGLLHTY
jgi:hypothetical protein